MLVALAGARPCSAQELERVEEVWGDSGPLNESFRQLPLDMRRPSAFEHLYRVPGSDTLLTRLDGGIAAVFPRSVYSSTRQGVVPLIPAGTVFYVGGVPEDPARRWGGDQKFESRSRTGPIQRGLLIRTPETRIQAEPTAVRSTQRVPTIWDDEFYRRGRINRLLGVVPMSEQLRLP